MKSRLASGTVIRWRIARDPSTHTSTLRDVTETGATIAPSATLRAGDELRFEAIDDRGESFAFGLAETDSVDDRGEARLDFRALGIDRSLLAPAEIPANVKRAPPKLPGVERGPPPHARRAPHQGASAA